MDVRVGTKQQARKTSKQLKEQAKGKSIKLT